MGRAMRQKLFAGAQIREVRARLELTQKALAARLGVSLPYLNQMENDHRPISAQVMAGLAQRFGVDVRAQSDARVDALMEDLRRALADPVFAQAPMPDDLRQAAVQSPGLARAFLTLHSAYCQAQEAAQTTPHPATPEEAARAFITAEGPYIDALDRAAETLSFEGAPEAAARARMQADGLHLREAMAASDAPDAVPLALLERYAAHYKQDLIAARLDQRGLSDPAARTLAAAALARSFALAALLPYRAFQRAAKAARYDLDVLAARFGAPVELVAERLATLRRPGQEDLGFFFLLLDQNGTLIRQSAAPAMGFARYGGPCPLSLVSEAFAAPGHYMRQVAATPEGGELVQPGAQGHEFRRCVPGPQTPICLCAGMPGGCGGADGLCRGSEPGLAQGLLCDAASLRLSERRAT